jgi:four helix bundle protein
VALNIHRVTESIPTKHNGELISQIRNSAVSIPTNIVEGASRGADRDFATFVQIAIDGP